MVPRKRLELLHRKATASKTVVSTNSTTWADKQHGGPGRDRTYEGVSQRIYSPPHLTTLEPTHVWSHLSDLNWWPPVYKTGALPTELRWHVGRLYKKQPSCQKIFLRLFIFLYDMPMITILAVTDGFKHFGEAISEYGKRTQKVVTLKPIKPISHTNPEYIKIKETLAIIEMLKKMKWRVILLDERGKGMKTSEFSEMLEESKNTSENITFFIGWSYGVDLEVFADIPHEKIRISDFVMPHSLALLVLLEQIYRADEIMKGSGYHHS